MTPLLTYILMLLTDLFALAICLCVCAVTESGNTI